ncbi:MAG: universal stress protein [Clostridia bacterium]|nr:universal stress protein [Clostridia bacterium]
MNLLICLKRVCSTKSLVVLGSRGLKGVMKLLLGTVSGKVANSAKCSVFIVK